MNNDEYSGMGIRAGEYNLRPSKPSTEVLEARVVALEVQLRNLAQIVEIIRSDIAEGTGELDMSASLRQSTEKRWAIWRENGELRVSPLPLGAEPMHPNAIVVKCEPDRSKF